MSERLDEGFFADPHAYYRQWRQEGPVRCVDFGDGLNRWLVFGYTEGRALLTDPRLCKDIDYLSKLVPDKRGAPQPYSPPDPGMRHMLNFDAPDHTRLRKVVSKAFTARRIAALRPLIERTADELLTGMAAADEVDLLDAFAVPLPVAVICDLLDVAIDDHEAFREWTKILVGSLTPEADRARAGYEMVEFLRKMLQHKRSHPGDDLLSILVADDEARLDESELIGMALLLLVAGHETTVNLIGNGTLALLRDRARWDRLRADPAAIPAAIEEFLRLDGPVNLATTRYTTEPIAVGDTVIPAGELVYIALAAANRDPDQYPAPADFAPEQNHTAHLAFGHGIHFCLGAPLARLEGAIAFTALLERYPNLHLAVPESELRWYPNPIIRGLAALPVRLH
ncbi:cytochrome P450 family protein [Nocardia inohanensis]|uniref:cytochrome P450 family protein n=1 Tax=Nocardia inohanensis TaxID=209246 RepID=UPI0008347A7C|nr:cytochrome P450 [Nocardia inohanensis]